MAIATWSNCRDLATAEAATPTDGKPVLLYSLYFHAQGEEQYLPDGTYSETLARLKSDFEVRCHDKQLNQKTLADVDVLLIVNPSDKAQGGQPPPHMSENDVYEICLFVQRGGGLIFLSNQSTGHNCEKKDSNRLLEQFGMRVTHWDVGVKVFPIPESTPLLGGLRWRFMWGSLLDVRRDHFTRPRVLVENSPDIPVQMRQLEADDTEPQPQGEVGIRGPLLAMARIGQGRVVVATDTGWTANWALDEADNWEIFRRLTRWAGSNMEEKGEGLLDVPGCKANHPITGSARNPKGGRRHARTLRASCNERL